jgi:hypothetical protein
VGRHHCRNRCRIVAEITAEITGEIAGEIAADIVAEMSYFCKEFEMSLVLLCVFRIMIGLMELMFGDIFWENVIIAATYWNYHERSISLRSFSSPRLDESYWQNEFNRLFEYKYGMNKTIPAVFIDPFYNKSNANELEEFNKHTDALLNFAKNQNPFEFKDIKKALTEIRILEDTIGDLQEDKDNKIKTIQQLRKDNSKLNDDLEVCQNPYGYSL